MNAPHAKRNHTATLTQVNTPCLTQQDRPVLD